MIVAPRFEGDADTALMMVQHACYAEVIDRWTHDAAARCFDAEALLGVRTEMGERLRDLDGLYDHRNLQDAHDLMAAAFRCRGEDAIPQRTLPLFDEPESKRMAWLDFAHEEIEQVLRSPPLSRTILQSLAYGGSAVGMEARELLAAGLRERYADVPFSKDAVADLPPRSGRSEAEEATRALFLSALSCLDPVPYAAWYRGLRAQEAQNHGYARLTDEQIREEWEALLATPELRTRFKERKTLINQALRQRPILPAGSMLGLSPSRIPADAPAAVLPAHVEKLVAVAKLTEPLLGRYGDVKRVAYMDVEAVVRVRISALPGGLRPLDEETRAFSTPVRRSDDGEWLIYQSSSLNLAVQHLVRRWRGDTTVTQRNANLHAALLEKLPDRIRMTPLEYIRDLFERGEWTPPTETQMPLPGQGG